MGNDASMELAVVNEVGADPIPAFAGVLPADLREQMTRAVKTWKLRTPTPHTRRAYESDLEQFLVHAGIEAGESGHDHRWIVVQDQRWGMSRPVGGLRKYRWPLSLGRLASSLAVRSVRRPPRRSCSGIEILPSINLAL